MLRIGYHVSIAGGISNAFDYSAEIGSTSMQIFLSSPRVWNFQSITIDERTRFIEKGKTYGITPVFVHMPYLPNLASPKEEIYKKSADLLSAIVNECETLGIQYVIAHLGSDLGEGKKKGMRRVIDAVVKVKERENGVSVLLENQAGQKNSIGSDLDDLREIYNGISSKEVGFCVDTCHLFAAGYDVRKNETARLLDETLKFKNIRVMHLNDAKFELGSGRDRHECIGIGEIGINGFKSFFSYEKTQTVPLILETPHAGKEQELKELEAVRKLLD